MSNKEKLEKWLSENSLTILGTILFLAVTSAVLVIGFYVAYFRSFAIEVNAEPWGQFGDFFGGTLNPIFGFLSVMALLAALVIQSRELKVSSEELRNSALALNAQNKAIAHQSFEQTFFSWLGNYRDMLGSISQSETIAIVTGTTYSGRIALQKWLDSGIQNETVLVKMGLYSGDAQYSNEIFERASNEEACSVTKAVMNSWDDLYRKYEYQLDSLFRNLYRLILWIDSQGDDRVSAAQKWLYVSIVRAQISWVEMAYLFYNGYTERGSKFKRLAEKYALFDNMNFDSDPVIAHVRKYPPENISYAGTAYDSCLARNQLGLPESTEETLAMAVI